MYRTSAHFMDVIAPYQKKCLWEMQSTIPLARNDYAKNNATFQAWKFSVKMKANSLEM